MEKETEPKMKMKTKILQEILQEDPMEKIPTEPMMKMKIIIMEENLMMKVKMKMKTLM